MRSKLKVIPDYDEFFSKIAKTLYYGNTSPVDHLSLPLTELAAELYNEVKKDCSLEDLKLEEAAEIARNACVSTCSLVVAILYLERIKKSNPEYAKKVSPSELFLVSLLIASKFLNDGDDEDYVLNCEWAASSGISLQRMNEMEKLFLKAINWEVFVTQDSFWDRLKHLEIILAYRESNQRGWLSYTELCTLLHVCHCTMHLKQLATVLAICLTGYVTSLAAIATIGLSCAQLTHGNHASSVLYDTTNLAIGTFKSSLQNETISFNEENSLPSIEDCSTIKMLTFSQQCRNNLKNATIPFSDILTFDNQVVAKLNHKVYQNCVMKMTQLRNVDASLLFTVFSKTSKILI